MSSARVLILIILSAFLPVMGLLSAHFDGDGKRGFISYDIAGKLKSGDIILRNGKGLVSTWFRNCSLKDPRYSHAGIVLFREGGWVVAHVQQSDQSGLKLQSLESFTGEGRGWAVCRVKIDEPVRQRLLRLVAEDHLIGIDFDDNFSLDEGQAMYCTEWINSVYARAEGADFSFPLTETAGFRYIACDNLYLNPRSTLIVKFEKP